jgi:type VII secretion protein EccB
VFPGSATRAPATRDQADAYRFGLRRMEAALVRGDPVPLHEQIRAQRRASLAGVVLGLLGLCGTAVYAAFVPSPNWRAQSVVVGAGSGAMYAVVHGPDRLVPVADLPAARLVLAALGDPDAGRATPEMVPDASLDGAPRTPTAAVAGAVGVRTGAMAAGSWAVCDEVDADGRVRATTVVGGAALAPHPGVDVLLAGPDDTTWLVTGGARHRVDTGDGRLRAAFRLTDELPRAATAALVSSLPEGPALATPEVAGRGDPAPAGVPGRVGDVLVDRPVHGGPRFLVVLRGGLQEVPAVLAELLRVASGAREVRPVDADVLGTARFVDDLPVAGWPTAAPRLQEPDQAPVTCWTWSVDGPPAGGVWTGTAVPSAPGAATVALAQADGTGERVDAVTVGAGGAVRATAPGRAPGAGPLWLVSGSGVASGVADDATAVALGVTAAGPAPEAALRLLPTGPVLDLAQAGRVVDVLRSG